MNKISNLKEIASRRTPGEWVVSAPLENDHKEYLNEIQKSYYEEARKVENDNPVINVAGEKIIPNFYDYEEAGVPRFDAEFIAMAANNIDKLLRCAEVLQAIKPEYAFLVDYMAHKTVVDASEFLSRYKEIIEALAALDSE